MAEQVAGVSEDRLATRATSPPMGPPLARRLAWIAIAGQLAFVASWIVAGALQPGYSHVRDPVSTLGGHGTAHPWIVDTGIVVLGLSIAALGLAVLAPLPRRTAARVAAGLFAASGLTMAAIGLLPVDCNFADSVCRARFDAGSLSSATYVHAWLGLAFDVLFLGTPFAIARALWPSPVAAASLASGLFGVGFTALSWLGTRPAGLPEGLVDRIGSVVLHLWVLIVAVGVLHALRSEDDDSVLVPVRPRTFFGRAWAGPGQLTLHPALLWRRFPLRLSIRRESEPLTDEAWVFTDTTRFDNGFSVARRMVLVMDGPDRVKVVAEDMPGGAELVLTEGGYRVRPYRLRYPLGPIGITLRCHDRVRELPDGSLDWTIAFRWHGLPAAVISARIRQIDGAAAAPA